jgi:hypothetical protein
MSDESYFIQIADPSEVRRNLLESSKHILRCMQSYEHVMQVREKRIHKAQELRNLLRETGILLARFKQRFPKEKLANLPRLEQKETPSPFSKAPASTEIEALERELSHIEQRLSRI